MIMASKAKKIARQAARKAKQARRSLDWQSVAYGPEFKPAKRKSGKVAR